MQRRTALALGIGLLAAATPAGAANGNLVTNGTFATPAAVHGWRELPGGSRAIPGWTISAGDVDIVGTYWQAVSGANSVELDGVPPGAIEQRIATQPGHTYRLSFMLAGNPDGPPARKLVAVTAGDVQRTFAFDASRSTKAAMGYVRRTIDFRAARASTLIRFANAEGRHFWGPVIDDVAVTDGSAGAGAVTPVETAAPIETPAAAVSTPAPVKTMATMPSPHATGPVWHSPASYDGDWMAYYPQAPVKVHIVENGASIVARPVDGSRFPHDQVLWYGARSGSRFVVTDHCADPGAQGWHGGVVTRTSPKTFTLMTADCAAGTTLYVRT